MRLVQISHPADLKALRKMLLTSAQPAATAAAALERVKRLNPHLDLQHLAAGAVLLVPDLPGVDPADARVVGDDVFQAVSSDIGRGLKTVASRVDAGMQAQEAERNAVDSAIALDAVKGLTAADEGFRKQVDAALARFDADRDEARRAVDAVATLEKGAAAELNALARLLGLRVRDG